MAKDEKKEKLPKAQKIVKDTTAKLTYLVDQRFPDEKVWWEIQSFIDGYHYQIFRDLKNTSVIDLRPIKFKTGQIRRAINLFRKVYRDMKTQITVANYNWAVMGGKGGEEKYLHSYFKKYNIAQILANVVGMGFKRSAGYAEAFWNGDRVVCRPIERFNIYEDPKGKFFIKIYKKRRSELEEAKNSDGELMYDIKKDDWKNLEQTDKQSHSHLYNHLYKRSHPGAIPEDGGLKEYKVIELIEPNEKGVGAKITAISGKVVIREDTADTYKIVKYTPESEESQPLLEPIMHPAKALNRLTNHIEDYVRRMTLGVYMKRKGEKTSEIKAEHGHFIEYKNRQPEQMQMQALPPTVFQFMDYVVNLHSTLSGVRIQDLPSGLSGKALAMYEAINQQNAVEPLENLKVFLRELGRAILEITDKKMAIGQTFFDKKDEEVSKFKVIGATAGELESPEGYEVIGTPSDIDIEIVPGGALSRLAQKEEAKELYQLGLMDAESTLEIVAMGNIKVIIDRVQAEKEKALQTGTDFRVGAGGGGAPAGGESPLGGGADTTLAETQKELPKAVAMRSRML